MSSLQRDFERWFGDSSRGKDGGDGRKGGASRPGLVVVAVLLFLFIAGSVAKSIYTEWLWFGTLGFESVYTTIITTRIWLFAVGAVLFIAIFLGNIYAASRLSPKRDVNGAAAAFLPFLQKFTRGVVVVVSGFLALMFGLAAQGSWETVLRFLNGQPFGVTDPVFSQEVSFYVFTLPFLSFLRGWLLTAIIFTLIATVAVYAIAYTSQGKKFNYARGILIHGGALIVAIAALAAMSYWLGIWDLVYSPRGAVFGAGFTDIHAQVPAQWALLIATVLLGGAILMALIRRRVRWAMYGVGLWIVLSIVVGQVIPGLMQRFYVQPNELKLETEYIGYNIEATREAFGLTDIDERDYPAEPAPTAEDIENNSATVNNIRLWDHRPLLDTYNQIQSIRLYYDFLDIDIDRYTVDGEYRQVMLSARELSRDRLPSDAQTWVNRTLQYTHGYGIAMSPVNEVRPDGGLPVLWIQDLPPSGVLEIDRPELYYAERAGEHVIVDTKTQEFDYPSGEENVFTTYEGEGGVPIGSLLRRALYAWERADFNILISSQLNSESRIMYHRDIQERVKRIAPFLSLDADPYVVVHEGRLLWIQDCYTTSTRYPYSNPWDTGVNYVRNSVKAVVDAYDGKVSFYSIDPDDPMLQTYGEIFPALFQPMEEMPEGLRAHIRYPEDLFNIQASVYRAYHMTDPRVFYNREDLWAFPNEYYAGAEQPMESYYVIMRLPDEENEEFLMMLPYTPSNKNNAIGWLAGRSDGENYGELVVYRFPKDRLIYGPSQIENRIQQDTAITEQLALWSRGGARVLRGNLLVIPIGDSTLYVECVFLQADTGGLPELQRVIVAAGEEIAMERTLEESLFAIFGPAAGDGIPPVDGEPADGEPLPEGARALIEQAQTHFESAQQAAQNGDWATYGEEIAALEEVLADLAELTG
mgnify:CR=1 FL=1